MLEVDKNNNTDELEDYGVWVKSGPENYIDSKDSPADNDFELTDLESNPDNFLLTEEEETLLDSLEKDVKTDDEDFLNIQEVNNLDFNDDEEDENIDADSSFDDTLLDTPADDSSESDNSFNIEEDSLEEDDSFETEEKEEFIDINIAKPVAANENQNNEKSADIISQIAADLKNDLSAIKNELHELKMELARYKKTEGKEKGDSVEDPENNDEKAASRGFFSDDGDETIALTGDELDNIFNTAEITEESKTESSKNLKEKIGVKKLDTEEFSEEPEIDTTFDIEEDDIDINNLPDIEDDFTIDENIDMEDSELDIETPQEDESMEIEESELDIELPQEDEIIEEAIDEITLEGSAYEENRDELSFLDGKIDETSEKEKIILDDVSEVDDDKEITEEDFKEIRLDDEDIKEDSDKDSLDEELTIDGISHEEPSDIKKGITFEEESSDEEIALEPSKAARKHEKSDAKHKTAKKEPKGKAIEEIPDNLKTEIKSVLVYLDQLLEALPDNKIDEFAKSEHFKTYKKLFEELDLM